MRLLYVIILIFIAFNAQCQVSDYLNALRVDGTIDIEYERSYLLPLEPDSLVKEFKPFLNDSSLRLRRRMLEIYYRKAQLLNTSERAGLLHELIKGCNDADISIQLTCVNYLKNFSRDEFDDYSVSELNHLLEDSRLSLDKDFILLAGYVGFGKEQLLRRLSMSDNYSTLQLYWMHLALARMDVTASAEYCLDVALKVNDQNDLVSYVLPQLIYTRHRKAINYCIELLYSDEQLCYSPDPDNSAKFSCGYRIMELLAPAISNYPYQLDYSGTLATDNYEQALLHIRKWLKDNPDYQISTTSY